MVRANEISLPALREVLRRSVLTLGVVPDTDLRFRLGPATAWPEFVRHTRDAYGSAPPRFRIFQPTRADLSVYLVALSWVAWYRRENGPETPRIFAAWCLGAAMWQLQERVSTNRRRPASPRTVYNRIDAMLEAIAVKFREEVRNCVDVCGGLQNVAGANVEGEGIASDVRDLPKSPRLWVAAGRPEKLDARAKAQAHAELERVLQRNGSRSRRRAKAKSTIR